MPELKRESVCIHDDLTKHRRTFRCVYYGDDACFCLETHCRRCNKFLWKCFCGSMDRATGWSMARWESFWKRKDKQRGKG